jgi:hypothetical protein
MRKKRMVALTRRPRFSACAAQDVQAALGPNERPAVNTAQHGGPFSLPTFVYAYNGVVFEVLRNGRLASVTLWERRARAH